MDRLIADASVDLAHADTAPLAGTPQYGTDGDPATNTPATVWPAYQYNAMQEEIVAVILASGLALDRTNNAQMLAAMRKLFRIKLLADTVFYVSTIGDDANAGTIGAPWATVQHAIDVLTLQYDLNGKQATVQLADGTYAAGANVSPLVGGVRNQSIIITGNAADHSLVKITSVASCFTAAGGASIAVNNMQLKSTGAGNTCFGANTAGNIAFSGIIFDSAPLAHMICNSAGYISSGGNNYAIIGGSQFHGLSTLGAVIGLEGSTAALTGNPNFSNAFAGASLNGSFSARTFAFTGAATGSRYSAVSNGVIDTNGGGANFFPGNAAGSTSTQGLYL